MTLSSSSLDLIVSSVISSYSLVRRSPEITCRSDGVKPDHPGSCSLACGCPAPRDLCDTSVQKETGFPKRAYMFWSRLDGSGFVPAVSGHLIMSRCQSNLDSTSDLF